MAAAAIYVLDSAPMALHPSFSSLCNQTYTNASMPIIHFSIIWYTKLLLVLKKGPCKGLEYARRSSCEVGA
eukprot:15359886-Ditylum_brightwellii.AAC.1